MDREDAEMLVRWHDKEMCERAMNMYEAEMLMQWRADEIRNRAELHFKHRTGPTSRRRSVASALAQILNLS